MDSTPPGERLITIPTRESLSPEEIGTMFARNQHALDLLGLLTEDGERADIVAAMQTKEGARFSTISEQGLKTSFSARLSPSLPNETLSFSFTNNAQTRRYYTDGRSVVGSAPIDWFRRRDIRHNHFLKNLAKSGITYNPRKEDE